VTVTSSGQASLFWSLPRDTMGSILDPVVLEPTITDGLRLLGSLELLHGSSCAVGIGLGGSLSMLTEDRVTGVARTRMSGMVFGSDPVRVGPDEVVSLGAFDRRAGEVARSLTHALMDGFRARR
jgi:hypothetical protein